MDELGVARAIRDGELPSPQKYDNVWLFAIRITGTGLAYRPSIDEHVWRDKSLYLNDEFLERCQGLAVIWIHPDKAVLDSKEFAERVIGAVMIPFIKDEDVWGIAKIYDDEAAKEMSENPISTSPGVKIDPATKSVITTDDGNQLLVEGKLSLLDHIAVVKNGVWDKGGPPTGVQNDQLERVDSMPSDDDMAADKARKDADDKKADQARKDADAGAKLDKLLTHLDAVTARMDAWDDEKKADKARADADDKERADKARADAAARRDAEHSEWKKADAEGCARDDAEEETEKKKMVEGGEPEEVAADKARKDRRDRMDARRKDGEEAMKKKEEDEKADAATRKDSSRIETLERELAAIKAISRPIDESDRAAFADEQSRADAVYMALGKRAEPPMGGETLGNYKVRLARGLQKHSKQWAGIELHRLTADAMDIAATQIRADAIVAARNPEDLADGQLREIINVDPTGRRISTFVGNGSFIDAMRGPSRVVRKINTKAGA